MKATEEETLALQEMEALRWSVEQLETEVFAGNPKVAVFDCDGTLWGGDSGNGFMVWSMEQGLVSRSMSDWMDNRYRAYLAGAVSEVEMCGEMVQMYAGLREQELQAAAARYVEGFVRKRVFAEMAALTEKLSTAGVELWAVSSTNKWVIAAGAAPFGIPEERVLAAEVEVKAGLIGSKLVDVPSGEGKAAALKRVGLPHPDAVFGNSVHDLAMLEMARKAYPVNPSPALLEAVGRHGWGFFRPRGSAPEAVGGE